MQNPMTTLFHEVERLDNRSLDTFISNIVSLRARRSASDKQKREAYLLEKINKSLSIQETLLLQQLHQKHLEENITEQEYAKLSVLIEKMEKLNVSRLKYMTQLAQFRGVSVRELMAQLGINQRNG
jgi:DNA gyrase/topoisomerase IV subunit A